MGNFVSIRGSGQDASEAASQAAGQAAGQAASQAEREATSEEVSTSDPAAPRDADPSGNDAQNYAPRGNFTTESTPPEPPVIGAPHLDASGNATSSSSSPASSSSSPASPSSSPASPSSSPASPSSSPASPSSSPASPSSQQGNDDDQSPNRNLNYIQAANNSVTENATARGGQVSAPLEAPVDAGLPPGQDLVSLEAPVDAGLPPGQDSVSLEAPVDAGLPPESTLASQAKSNDEAAVLDSMEGVEQSHLQPNQPETTGPDSDGNAPSRHDQAVEDDGANDQPELQPQDSDSDVDENMLMDQPQLPADDGAGNENPAAQDLEPEIAVVQRFIAEIGAEAQVLFFNGTLADAIHASCGETLSDRKPLALYLHEDNGDEQHQFIKKITENAEIGRLLKEEFVTWGWNITDKSQKQRLLEMLKNRFGNSMRNQVTSIRKCDFPALILIVKERGSYDVAGVCEGRVSSEEILDDLKDVLALFLETKSADLATESENEQRRAILREQDQAYEDSLAQDREKQRNKEEEERLAREREEEEERTRKRKREEEEEEMRKRRRIQDAIKETLPAEPDGSDGSVITTICLKTPSGDLLQRNFLASEPLQTLFQFCASEGFALTEYRFLCGFPRLDLASNDSNQSLQHFQLCPRALILLDKRSTEEEESTSIDD